MTTNTLEGGCRCGAVRYRIFANPLPRAYACHCRDCQTWSGSAFSVNILLPESAFEVSGPTHQFDLESKSTGHVSLQRGCAVCLTRVYNRNTARPGRVVVRAGTLDRSDEVTIVAHIWVKRKMAGIDIPPAVPAWPESAPPEEFLALVGNP